MLSGFGDSRAYAVREWVLSKGRVRFVKGILAFAERVLPRTADLWVQAFLEQRQQFQRLFFPEVIAFDGKGLVRTGATAPTFSYLHPIEGNERLVDQGDLAPDGRTLYREPGTKDHVRARSDAMMVRIAASWLHRCSERADAPSTTHLGTRGRRSFVTSNTGCTRRRREAYHRAVRGAGEPGR